MSLWCGISGINHQNKIRFYSCLCIFLHLNPLYSSNIYVALEKIQLAFSPISIQNGRTGNIVWCWKEFKLRKDQRTFLRISLRLQIKTRFLSPSNDSIQKWVVQMDSRVGWIMSVSYEREPWNMITFRTTIPGAKKWFPSTRHDGGFKKMRNNEIKQVRTKQCLLWNTVSKKIRSNGCIKTRGWG